MANATTPFDAEKQQQLFDIIQRLERENDAQRNRIKRLEKQLAEKNAALIHAFRRGDCDDSLPSSMNQSASSNPLPPTVSRAARAKHNRKRKNQEKQERRLDVVGRVTGGGMPASLSLSTLGQDTAQQETIQCRTCDTTIPLPRCYLLDLPEELRKMIYSYVLQPDHLVVEGQRGLFNKESLWAGLRKGTGEHKWRAALLATCRQINDEAGHLLYEPKALSIHLQYDPRYMQLPCDFDPSRLSGVKKLHILSLFVDVAKCHRLSDSLSMKATILPNTVLVDKLYLRVAVSAHLTLTETDGESSLGLAGIKTLCAVLMSGVSTSWCHIRVETVWYGGIAGVCRRYVKVGPNDTWQKLGHTGKSQPPQQQKNTKEVFGVVRDLVVFGRANRLTAEEQYMGFDEELATGERPGTCRLLPATT